MVFPPGIMIKRPGIARHNKALKHKASLQLYATAALVLV